MNQSDSGAGFSNTTADVPNDSLNSCSSTVRNSSGTTTNSIRQLPVLDTYRPNISFSDIENIIVPFDGSSFQNIEKWIDDFEDVANTLNLSDLHKFVFAKRSITGKAKLLVQSESKINSFEKLKKLLISEFGINYNSAELHEMLSKRKMKDNESIDEYFLIMKQLCFRGNIEDDSLMQYVINGINDSVMKKSLLYGCKTIEEFKQKLTVYKKVKADCEKTKLFKPRVDTKFEVKNNSKPANQNAQIKCYQCGDKNHRASECTSKELRCFYCKAPNHKISACPKKARQLSARALTHQNNSSVNQIETITTPPPAMTLTIDIQNLSLPALVDTGSPYTLIRESVHRKLGSPVLYATSLTLTGLGATVIYPTGFFHMPFTIQNTAFTSDFFVIPDNLLSVEIILGQNVLQQAEFKLNKSGIELIESDINNSTVHFCVPLEPHSTVTEVNTDSEVMSSYPNDSFSGVVQSSTLPDLAHILDRDIRTELLQLISSYKPNKIKSPDVEMNIVLSDDRPVHHRPRRQASSNKAVDSKSDNNFKVMLNVKHFRPDEIDVKTVDNFVVIHGKHEEHADEHGFVSREFTRRYQLPDDVIPEKVTSSLSKDGVLTIQAPRKMIEPPKNERIVPITIQQHAAVEEAQKLQEQQQQQQQQQDYCKDQNIDYVPITTGIPRANGQIERMLQTVIPVLSKLSIEDPSKWFRYVEAVQRTLNSTVSSSTKRSPFELLVGVPMRHKQDATILKLLEEEHVNSFIDQRNALRNVAKENILKIQESNKRNFNKRRKKAHQYKLNDLVAIARTQFGSGLKLRPRFYGPYKIIKVKPNDRYDVQKMGTHEGPNLTSSSADHMKPWTSAVT